MLRFPTCGNVDDGKSTLIGRLLHDSKMIYEDQLEAVTRDSAKSGTTGEQVDLALLVDGLQAEREQGITIDVAYRYFTTDMDGTTDSGGFIVNLNGQILGVITTEFHGDKLGNLIRAYSISDLKNTIEIMSNQEDMPYLGVKGMDVSTEANQDLNVPYGAFVTEIEMESPAMNAGIQPGDVITAIDKNSIDKFSSLATTLEKYKVSDTVEVTIMRLSGEEYVPMSSEVVLGQFF